MVGTEARGGYDSDAATWVARLVHDWMRLKREAYPLDAAHLEAVLLAGGRTPTARTRLAPARTHLLRDLLRPIARAGQVLSWRQREEPRRWI
ncbi:MAG: hypothetical protein HY332_04015 [Chloroflexi bacterium]|nr:hypothetical protein [Chloroflexota bacterium]